LKGASEPYSGRWRKTYGGLLRVGSVSALMQEAASRLFGVATVSNPPHC